MQMEIPSRSPAAREGKGATEETCAGIKGVIPPVPTVVDENGALDRAGMAELLDRLIHSQVNGLLILGTGGEFCHMGKTLRREVCEFAVEYVAGRLPVLVNIGDPATSEVIDLGRHAASVGVQAALAINPYYTSVTAEGLYRHYCSIADAVDLPLLLYNFPALTGEELSIDVVRRIALSCPTVVGIKDSVENFAHTRLLVTEVKSARPDFRVFSGYDEYLLYTLLIGGDGGFPATANFAPDICCGIYRAVQERDFDRTVTLQTRLAKLSRIYGLDTPFFGLIKEAIRLTGSRIPTAVLSPALAPSEETKAKLVEVLTQAGVLPVNNLT
jgi:2-dehydro-3-deoxy-D-pentonate aldolase